MKRILIIEDHQEIRDLIRLTLELEDWQIDEAADGQSGLEAAARLHPDLVLLDVMMPGSIDGFEVCERLRADPAFAHTRIVMLTARALADDRNRGLQVGADAYLAKPFSPKHLLEIIDQLI